MFDCETKRIDAPLSTRQKRRVWMQLAGGVEVEKMKKKKKLKPSQSPLARICRTGRVPAPPSPRVPPLPAPPASAHVTPTVVARSARAGAQRGNGRPPTAMASQVVLATAGYDHTVRFWEATSGICYRTLQYADSQVGRGRRKRGERHINLTFFFRRPCAHPPLPFPSPRSTNWRSRPTNSCWPRPATRT